MISNVLRCVIIGLLIFSLVHAQETQGTPGVDYPSFDTIPNTSFKCSDQEFIPGFYADLEAQCQVYHYCSEDGQETFLCPIGSIFNQAKLACDVWHNSNCTVASQLYNSNSGFLLESAMKNVPLLIKLRNRSNKRLSFREPASNVHEKITSVHDGSELYQSSEDGSSVSNDVNADQNPDKNEDNQGEQLNEDESLDDILNRLEASIQNDEPADGIYYDIGDRDASDNNLLDANNLFFDPVTEQYYVDPDSSENEWSPNFDDGQFGYYDRENFAYKYSLAMKDAAESRDLYGLNKMNNEGSTDAQFLKRQMDIEQPLRRLRRKPIYTVSQDERPSGMTDGMDSVMDAEDDVTTESVSVVTDSSQPSAEITTGIDRSYTMAPFDVVEDLSRMHMTPLNITERPMTSEEFEEAIITELIVPKIDEHDLRVLASSYDQEQANAGETQSDVRNDGYYRYDENESPEQFEYSNVYDAESEDENLMSDSRASDQIDDAAGYYQYETADGDPGKSDDTFVVIPDESEIPEFSEAFDTSASSEEATLRDLSYQNVNEDAAAHDSMEFNIPTSYESSGTYSAADPSQYRTSRYSPSVEYDPDPEQYFRETYLNIKNEESSSPNDYADESYVADDSQAMVSEHHQYGFEARDPTNQYMYTSPGSYACQQQIGYDNCMYGSQSGFPYPRYYDHPFVNFPYGVSDVESTESRVSGVDGSYYPESQVSYMIPSAPYMNNEQYEVNPDYERPYQDQNFDESGYPDEDTAPDNSRSILENENVGQETYYVLEDDEPSSEVDAESVSEPSSLYNIDGVSDVTGNQRDTYYVLEDEKVMEDVPEVKTFEDISENEEVKEQQAFPQDKSANLEELPPEHSDDGKPSQTADYKDFSQSEEKSALGDDSAESVFGSIMDSRFTHVTNGGPFTTKSDRNGDVQLDSSEQLTRNDETPKVLVSSHGDFPSMFLNNMAYSDSINFGPHGFGSNLGQSMTGGSPTPFSFANERKRTGDSAPPNVSKLSALQERIRSLKQGKFGAFKKYVNSPGSKN